MNVILRTRCGCQRVVAVHPSDRAFCVAMEPERRAWVDEPADALAIIPITARRFEWRGKTEGALQIWEECGYEQAAPPGPPKHFSTGEWADAVARFRQMVRGDLPEVEAEFMRRHDGATLIQHEATRVLVGAFYPAPGWSHSEEAVRLFTELRRLLTEAP